MKRVLLAMSGGVDSSVAAYLLCEAKYEVVGLFMRSGVTAEVPAAVPSNSSDPLLPVLSSSSGPAGHKKGCCSAQDAADARRVADQLDIPFYAIDFADEFGQIMDYFADEYIAGRTPNPCVVCNNWLKFGKLWVYAQQVGADYIATGHYAQIETTEDEEPSAERNPVCGARPSLLSHPPRDRLLRAVDPDKDQSYVLFGLRRELLPHILFPVGGYRKQQIRSIAQRLGLRVAEKPESQEICFVAAGRYADFVRRRRPQLDTGGEIVDTSGQTLGYHSGLENFTIGQRRGLGIAMGSPRYVVAVEPDSRRVVIGTREELARRDLEVDRMNWLIDEPTQPLRCRVKIRYRHEPAPAVVEAQTGGQARIRFDTPQYGVAPGQAAVFYDADRVLGGGWIR